MPARFRDEEARRVEPRLPLTQFQVVPGPAALFGMLGEGPAVEAQPLILILARDEGAQRAAGRKDGAVQRAVQRTAHLPQGAEALETRDPGQPGGRGQVAVRPEPQRVAACRRGELADQGPAEPLPAAVRVDHELAAHVRFRIGRQGIQVGVARGLAARGEDEITTRLKIRARAERWVGAVVAQVQHHVLGQRLHAVGQARGPDQGQDVGDLGGAQYSVSDVPCGHRAAVAARAPRSCLLLARSSPAALSPAVLSAAGPVRRPGPVPAVRP